MVARAYRAFMRLIVSMAPRRLRHRFCGDRRSFPHPAETSGL